MTLIIITRLALHTSEFIKYKGELDAELYSVRLNGDVSNLSARITKALTIVLGFVSAANVIKLALDIKQDKDLITESSRKKSGYILNAVTGIVMISMLANCVIFEIQLTPVK